MKMLDSIEELKSKTSRAPIRCECEYCAKEFCAPKNIVMRALKGSNKGKYCSVECRRLARQVEEKEFVCANCSQSFFKLASAKGKKMFCSQTCANVSMGKARAKVLVGKTCACGNKIVRYQTDFCSQKCAHQSKDRKSVV